MFEFGRQSTERLATTHSGLSLILNQGLARSPYDITVIHGYRGQELQDALVDSGASHTRWPNSKHNHRKNGKPCSLAVDFAPWVNGGIPWKETHIFACIAGILIATADDVGFKVRWGGDWDGDGLTSDQTLLDWGHIEIVL